MTAAKPGVGVDERGTPGPRRRSDRVRAGDDRPAGVDPRPGATGDVGGVDALGPEELHGPGAAPAGLADHEDRRVGGQLAQPVGHRCRAA